MLPTATDELHDMMILAQKATSLCDSIRKELRLPSKLRLFEAQVDTFKDRERIFFLGDLREILKEAMNVDEVNPFIVPFGFGYWARRGAKVNGYTVIVQLCTIVSPARELEALEKNNYQVKMMEEKKAGTYDAFTYKKYKTGV